MKYNIYIDWDKRYQNKEVKVQIMKMLSRIFMSEIITKNAEIEKIYYRKSSRGNTHIKLEFRLDDIFKQEMDTFLLLQFLIRGIWEDDAMRILGDLKRYALSQDEKTINRIFDIKIINGKKYESGKWILVWER